MCALRALAQLELLRLHCCTLRTFVLLQLPLQECIGLTRQMLPADGLRCRVWRRVERDVQYFAEFWQRLHGEALRAEFRVLLVRFGELSQPQAVAVRAVALQAPDSFGGELPRNLAPFGWRHGPQLVARLARLLALFPRHAAQQVGEFRPGGCALGKLPLRAVECLPHVALTYGGEFACPELGDELAAQPSGVNSPRADHVGDKRLQAISVHSTPPDLDASSRRERSARAGRRRLLLAPQPGRGPDQRSSKNSSGRPLARCRSAACREFLRRRASSRRADLGAGMHHGCGTRMRRGRESHDRRSGDWPDIREEDQATAAMAARLARALRLLPLPFHSFPFLSFPFEAPAQLSFPHACLGASKLSLLDASRGASREPLLDFARWPVPRVAHLRAWRQPRLPFRPGRGGQPDRRRPSRTAGCPRQPRPE